MTELHFREKWESYPSYKDSGADWLGMIPSHWCNKRLKFIADTNMGQSPRSDQYNNHGYGLPFLQGNADFGPKYPNAQIYCPSPNKKANRADILLSVRAPVGALNIADQVYGIGRGLCSITPLERQLELDYAWYLLQTNREQLYMVSTGSTYEAVSTEDVKNLTCSVPPLYEQLAIADFLDHETAKLDDLIAKNQRLIELLQEKRTALISHAVTKGLDPNVPMKDSGVEWLGDIPEHWEVRKLKFLATTRFSNVDKHTKEGEHPVRLCNYVDVYYNEYITSDIEFMEATASYEEISKYTLKGSDVLITKDSETWDDIAVAAYVPVDLNGVLCGYHLAIVQPKVELLDGRFLFRSFSARGINDQFRIATTGITRYGLGKYWLTNSLFPTPPIEEQREIADFLNRETVIIDDLIAKVKSAIEKLQEYRTALISAAVTGKIDVRNIRSNH